MRIPKSWVAPMARTVVKTLFDEELIVPDVDRKVLAERIEAIMLDELMVEDRLNEEIKLMLVKHESDIDRGRLDYRTLFDMTKQKLVRERGLVI